MPKKLSPPEVHSRHAMTLCRRCAVLESEVRKRPFDFMGRAGSFSGKKNSRYQFLSEKNIQDRLNAIIRFVLYAK